jgi:hypothetical protein
MAISRKGRTEKLIIPNPDLLAAMKGWVPEFGDASDRWVLDALQRHEKKLREVDNKVLREGKHLTPKMQDILRAEQGLIQSINNRKMDF